MEGAGREGAQSAYDWWQARLAAEFFAPGASGRAVILYVDDLEARRLGLESDCSGLAESVLGVLDEHGTNIFSRVLRMISRWRIGPRIEPPPCLPVLAVFVLAASRMRTEGTTWSHNYYSRLAQVLKPDVDHERETGTGTFRWRLTRDSDMTEALWTVLVDWLEDQGGSRGLSTIRTAGSRNRIGFALSQAIIRASDHVYLERFFRAIGAGEACRLDAAKVLRDLRIWGAHRRGLSRRLQQALSEPDVAQDQLLGDLIVALAQSWDGTVSGLGTGSRRVLDMRLTLEDDLFTGWSGGWHAGCVGGIDTDVLTYGSATISVTADEGARSYRLGGDIPDFANVLRNGFHARGTVLEVTLPPMRILAMAEDPLNAGRWISTDELATYERYTLLVRAGDRGRVELALDRAGTGTVVPDDAPWEGWLIFGDVEFRNEALLRATLADLEGSGLTGLDYSPPLRPRLVNGLPVRTDLGRRHYLIGGEPDLALPVEDGRNIKVLLDGVEQVVRASGRLIPLRGLDLAAGKHRIQVAGTETDFHLCEPSPLVRAAGISAGIVPPASVMIRPGTDARFVTADGRFHWITRHHHTDHEPYWWRSRSTELRAYGFEADVLDEAVWLVVLHHDRLVKVVLLRALEPRITYLSGDGKEFWSHLVLDTQRDTPHRALWKRYCSAAMTIGVAPVLSRREHHRAL
ncbi:hypothetical protein AB0M43_35325 [Longispora sp. NPDC051575]|uniref:hypothetical protein n=1 Tax=Longispora sp. NPDC051575 TaxID=3154943 RepID=UPI003432056B